MLLTTFCPIRVSVGRSGARNCHAASPYGAASRSTVSSRICFCAPTPAIPKGRRVLRSSLPVLYSQTGDAAKLPYVASDEGGAKAQRLRRNERVHGPNAKPTRFQVVPDGCVMRGVVPGERFNR